MKNPRPGKAGGPFLSLSRIWAQALLCCCLGAPLFVPPADAAVPVKFTYQGNLRQAGFLVNGQRAMVFRLYNSSAPASAVLWTSPAYDVTVSTGVFRVTLAPEIADWQSGNLWLELEIAGIRMSPMEELTSSPYSINSLMLSGKRYESGASAPADAAPGDLWFDTSSNSLSFWDGDDWIGAGGGGGGGVAGAHAATHAGGGSDPITALGPHTVNGNLLLLGTLNPSSNLSVGGSGFTVSFASSVSAGWYHGNGSGLRNLNASRITSGSLSGDRIGKVIVSTHIVDGSITRQKLGRSDCNSGELLQWDGAQWICTMGVGGAGVETDPYAIHNQDALQQGATFYVSSGTVNDLTVAYSLGVSGTALLRGGPDKAGLSVEPSGNVGVGLTGAAARLAVRGDYLQNYSLAVGTGTAQQVVVSTMGAVGIGTETPAARLEVSGVSGSGGYIVIFGSGNRVAAYLRSK